MRIVAALEDHDFTSDPGSLGLILYAHASQTNQGSAGAAIREVVRRRKYCPTARAWDLLSIALSVISADLAGHRDRSPDGWTREFDLKMSVNDPTFWSDQSATLAQLLGFLSTDIWRLEFTGGGFHPAPERDVVRPSEDSVVLLSGGLDSFIGAIDLSKQGNRPFAVSQSVRGDEEKQDAFAALIGGGIGHLRLNHNARVPDPESMPSQRARSLMFLAQGVLMATSLARHESGNEVTLKACENGFISINPPLTDMRLGSLSTRTSHPALLGMLQRILDAGDFRVRIDNPYQYKTKGEMLLEGRDQAMLQEHAHRTTSCGRFKRYGYKHCGRCVPCLIRRAAFQKWGIADRTKYKYKSLSKNDKERAGYDDVRAAAMAVADVKSNGLDEWLAASLSSLLEENKTAPRDVARRGLEELEEFLAVQKVQ